MAGGTRLPLAFVVDLVLLEGALLVIALALIGLPAARRRLRPARPPLPRQVLEAGVFVAIVAGEVRARVLKR